ncbi:MAG: VOC family protein [Acidiferrobacterales bacterium]
MLQTIYNIHAIHHVSLIVTNCHISLNFYVDILGLKVDPNRPDLGYPGAWLVIGSSNKQQLHLMEFPEQAAKQKSDRDQQAHPGHGPHLALAVEDLSVIQAKLEQENIKYSLSRSGRVALFCADHDGNAIELIEV